MSSCGPTRRSPVKRCSIVRWAALEALIADIAVRVTAILPSSADPATNMAFERLLRFFKLDRMLLWKFGDDEGELVVVHCKRSRGVPLPTATGDATHFHWALRTLLSGKAVAVRNLKDLPPTAGTCAQHLGQEGVQCWLAVPLRRNGVVFGALVFEAIRRRLMWTAQLKARLQTIANILGGAVARLCPEELQRHSESATKSLRRSFEGKPPLEEAGPQFAARLLRVQEEERSRIGRELHDEFAQRLALLSIKLEEMEGASPTLQGRAQLGAVRREAQQLAVDVTQLSHRLHSSYLENCGLAAAVRNQCREVARLHQIAIQCRVGDMPAFIGRNTTVTIFRVLQEALHNVVKHSRASQVETDLFLDGQELKLRVIDNGIGFDATSGNKSPGLGLVSMRERLHLVGGVLAISSRRLVGTKVEVRVPVPDRLKRPARNQTDDAQEAQAV
jgi:signal transduction histidine kinase